MITRVVDTNVILTANGAHEGAFPECVTACVERLTDIRKSGVLVIDDLYEILNEYQKRTSPQRSRGAGDEFVKWALQNCCNGQHVHQVAITRDQANGYNEFPDKRLQKKFDAADRMFPAVANAHPEKPPILQAVDCKWLDWWPALHASDVRVEFVCEQDICKFYSVKFPKKPVPDLP